MQAMKSSLFYLVMGLLVAGVYSSATDNRESVDVLSTENLKDKLSGLRNKALTTSDAEDMRKYFSALNELNGRAKQLSIETP
ncbi:hypothetical protein [Klebsiella pneumoniae]|uniref:hypothetical protein n=1 Tax=Klebsiella pneumoniae TaxID=573 RepID=UPI000A36C922|nr:hypothetical protein [Klebsiella pneumoniae]